MILDTSYVLHILLGHATFSSQLSLTVELWLDTHQTTTLPWMQVIIWYYLCNKSVCTWCHWDENIITNENDDNYSNDKNNYDNDNTSIFQKRYQCIYIFFFYPIIYFTHTILKTVPGTRVCLGLIWLDIHLNKPFPQGKIKITPRTSSGIFISNDLVMSRQTGSSNNNTTYFLG